MITTARKECELCKVVTEEERNNPIYSYPPTDEILNKEWRWEFDTMVGLFPVYLFRRDTSEFGEYYDKEGY